MERHVTSREVVFRDRYGLHPRAARRIQASLDGLIASVSVENLDGTGASIDARGMLALISSGIRNGDRVRITADGADEVRGREDRDATAAAVQNLLLGATGFGLASYWGSVPDALWDPARRVAGVDDGHDLVALVYLGWPRGDVAAPPRPPAEVTWLE